MKRLFSVIVLASIILTYTLSANAINKEKQQAKVAYVLKGLKLNKDAASKLRPILIKYYDELADVKASHKQLKDKYAAAEEAGKLTAAQCDQLFESKQKQEAGELALRKKYYTIFKTVVTAPQAYKALKLSDDKIK